MAARMNRRALIRYGALGGAVAAAGPLTSAAAAPAPPAPAAPPPFELDEATVADLQKRIGSGADTARSIAGKYLARIEALNLKGPELRAVLEINPDALAIAEELDAERKAGKVRGPLHGIPVLIKDNIATADRMMTTAGSLALLGAIPATDAFVAKRLRDAGAVILGKTNLCEWANFRSTHSSSGWSGRGGQCRNPVRARPQPVRLELGLGGCGGGEPLRARGRHRDGRLDRVALEQLRPRRHQADARPRVARRHHPDRAQPGHGRARWRAPSPTPRSCSPRWPATTRPIRRRRAPRASCPWTTRVPRPEGPRGPRIGVAAQEALRLQRRGRPARRGGDRRHEAARRRHRRSGRHRRRSARSTTASSRSCSTSSRRT